MAGRRSCSTLAGSSELESQTEPRISNLPARRGLAVALTSATALGLLSPIPSRARLYPLTATTTGEVGPRGRNALFAGLLRRGLFAGCNPMCSRLQPSVQQAATLCAAGCNPMCSRLQPYVRRPLRRCGVECSPRALTLTLTLTLTPALTLTLTLTRTQSLTLARSGLECASRALDAGSAATADAARAASHRPGPRRDTREIYARDTRGIGEV